MASLTDSLGSLADDPACMHHLTHRCGLADNAGPEAYREVLDVVVQRLAVMGDDPIAAKSLLRTARSFAESDRSGPRSHFFEAGGADDEDLAHEVFGPQVDQVVLDVSSRLQIAEEQARGLVEITTGVAIASLVGSAGAEMTLATLRAPLLAEHAQRFDQAGRPPAGPTETALAAAAGPGPEEQSGGAPSRSKAWLLAIPAALVVAGAIALVVSTGGDEEPTLAFGETSSTTGADDEPSATESTTTTADPVAATTASESETETDDSDPGGESEESGASASVESPPIPIGAPETHAVVQRGTVFLRGHVPSAEVEGLIVAAVEGFAGAGNVVSEYEIDPTRPFEPGRSVPVYIADSVLFASGSAELSEASFPVLGLGLTLLQLQPSVTLEVTGHTDSSGSDAANLALSQARVDAVRDFFVSQGIAAERITAIGRGETEPLASNDTADGRQANRRVEFLVNDFSFS